MHSRWITMMKRSPQSSNEWENSHMSSHFDLLLLNISHGGCFCWHRTQECRVVVFFSPKLDNWWWLHRDWCRKQERVRCQIRCMDKSELLLRKAIALSPCSLATGTLLNHNSSVLHTNQSGYKVNQMTMAHRGNVPRVFSNARRDISILYFSYVSGELLRTTGTHSGLLLKLKICRKRISVFGSEVDAKRGC